MPSTHASSGACNVVLPLSKRGAVNVALSVHDISQNSQLSGVEKEALPLQVTLNRTGGLPWKPSAVFFDGPDTKHEKGGNDPAFIADNVTLAGWLANSPFRNPDDTAHSCSCTEDWHYPIYLDNDFIERNYDATTKPLTDAIMPGRWFTWLDNIVNPKIQIPLTAGSQPNASTFLLPGADSFDVELNAWHRSTSHLINV